MSELTVEATATPYLDLLDKNVFVRTVTNYFTGRLDDSTANHLILRDAAWVVDTGRFSVALATGELREVEPYPDVVYVNVDAIVDVSFWGHDLPREAK